MAAHQASHWASRQVGTVHLRDHWVQVKVRCPSTRPATEEAIRLVRCTEFQFSYKNVTKKLLLLSQLFSCKTSTERFIWCFSITVFSFFYLFLRTLGSRWSRKLYSCQSPSNSGSHSTRMIFSYSLCYFTVVQVGIRCISCCLQYCKPNKQYRPVCEQLFSSSGPVPCMIYFSWTVVQRRPKDCRFYKLTILLTVVPREWRSR